MAGYEPTTVNTKNNNMAGYATMLFDASSSAEFVPDFETKPSIITNASISTNYPSQYFDGVVATAGVNGKYGGLLVRPNDRNHSTYSGVIADFNDFNPGTDLPYVGPNYTSKKPAFVPMAYLPMSRDLSRSYTLMRPVASKTSVASATTSTTTAAISGVFHSAAFNDLNDFSTFAPAELNDISVTTKDYATQVPCYDGVVYTPGPEMLQRFTTPHGESSIDGTDSLVKTNAVVACLKSEPQIEYQSTIDPFVTTIAPNGSAAVDIAIPPVTVGSTLTVRLNVQLTTGARDAGVSLYLVAIGVNPVTKAVMNRKIELYRHHQSEGHGLDSAYSETSVDLTTFHDNQGYMLLPYLFATSTVGYVGDKADKRSFISVMNNSSAGYSNTGPGCLILMESIATGQTVQLQQLVNYEAVPNGALTKDVKTSSYSWRRRDGSEIEAAEIAFNSPNFPVRRVYTGPMYQQLKNMYAEGFSKEEIVRSASGFGSFLRSIATLAPVVGGMFGPKGAIVGQAINSVTDAFTRDSSPMIFRSSAAMRTSSPYLRNAMNVTKPRAFCTPMDESSSDSDSEPSVQKPVHMCAPTRHASSHYQPSIVNEYKSKKKARVPETQVKRVDVVRRVKKTMTQQPDETLLGTNTSRRPEGMAYFPTVIDGNADIEVLFVTDYPMESLVIANKKEVAEETEVMKFKEGPTAYTETTTTILGADGISEFTFTNRFSEDFQDDERAEASSLLAYLGCDGQYVTAISEGRLAGNSFMLALAAAALRIPPTVAFTGTVIAQEKYPNSIMIGAVGDIALKIAAAKAKGYKLICSPDSFESLQYSPWLTTDKVITPADILVKSLTTLDWAVCACTTLTDIIWPSMNVLVTSRKATTTDAGIVYIPPSAQTKPAPSEKPTKDFLKALFMVEVPELAQVFVKKVDTENNLSAPKKKVFEDMIVDYFTDKLENFSVNVNGVPYSLSKAIKSDDVTPEQLDRELRKQLFIHLITDNSKGLSTIGFVTGDVRRAIKAAISLAKGGAAMPGLFGMKASNLIKPSIIDFMTPPKEKTSKSKKRKVEPESEDDEPTPEVEAMDPAAEDSGDEEIVTAKKKSKSKPKIGGGGAIKAKSDTAPSTSGTSGKSKSAKQRDLLKNLFDSM